MPFVKLIDQIGNNVELTTRPTRIVSLVPSQTELLFSLGLDSEVVGITKFCVHPESWFRNKTRVGGTKNVKLNLLDELEPDLVIANKEENTRADVEAILERFPVYTSDIFNLEDTLNMMEDIGQLVGKPEDASQLVSNISEGFLNMKKAKLGKVLYVIWDNPVMCAGSNTFINTILERTGFENVLQPFHDDRYPTLETNELNSIGPDVVLLSSEPFPFKEKHIARYQDFFPKARVELVDGEVFSWYGSRLLHAPNYLQTLQEKLNS